ncbi:hypothetical protein M433DRAFT_487016 [Acidomyces richmondensis BFW]|nr:MAG: hypothetical protein FE78DRAFT_284319 [Acidomyces sp. 'richmondensis']KYG47585.1 hypothetical protein M433DRAFT_487016 [Acidomyces richmondensis BFW]
MVFVHGETGFCVHTHLLVLPAPSWISKSIHKSFTSLAGCAARRVGSPLFTAYPSRKNGNGRSVRHLPHVTAATGGKMSSTAVTKKGQQDVSSTGQQPMMESREQSASASASAGLNLNIFGAVAGAFSSKSKKESNPDGSSIEYREEKARAKGAGAGNLSAIGAAKADQRDRHVKQVGETEDEDTRMAE